MRRMTGDEDNISQSECLMDSAHIDGRLGHTENCTGIFILGNIVAPAPAESRHPLGAVATHASQ